MDSDLYHVFKTSIKYYKYTFDLVTKEHLSDWYDSTIISKVTFFNYDKSM